MSSTVRALLDTTYLLPSFGIRVRGLTRSDLAKMREAGLNGDVEYFCLSACWVELIGKVVREASRVELNLNSIVRRSVPSLLRSGLYRWIDPPDEAVLLAFRLRAEGHKDAVDNLLYATALVQGMRFITMDEALRKFLEERGYETGILVTHRELLRLIKR